MYDQWTAINLSADASRYGIGAALLKGKQQFETNSFHILYIPTQ